MTVKGGDKLRYALRVDEFDLYMRKVHGEPVESWENPTPDPVPSDGNYISVSPSDIPANFKGKRGIIMFSVRWKDATGHFDLWNGSVAAGHEYFYYATKVHLWVENTVKPLSRIRVNGR